MSQPFAVLVLGGYGVFGERIAAALARDEDFTVIIAGRDFNRARAVAAKIGANAAKLDTETDLAATLAQLQPHLVINCCGPFQGSDYNVPRLCISQGIHYLDLADGRDYVAGFSKLDAEAKAKGATAITGASTVPGISSAIIGELLSSHFTTIDSLDYGVTPGNQTPRGIATVAAILSYVGKPFETRVQGQTRRIFGWQGLHQQPYPTLGKRWLSNCDVPDLALFPKHYPSLQTIRFYAGLELSLLHLGLWLLSWPVRWKWLPGWSPYARTFRRVSLWFYPFGSAAGAMHVRLSGLGHDGNRLTLTWYLLAAKGDGPQIPATPCIILARKMRRGELAKGAYPCLGLFTRLELMQALAGYAIREEGVL